MRRGSPRQPVHRGLRTARGCRANSLESVRACHGRPGCHSWKPSICSFRTIPAIIPVFLNFLTITHSKKNICYCNSMTHRSIKKWYCYGFISLALLNALTALPQLTQMDHGYRDSGLPAKRWVWAMGGTSRRWRRQPGSCSSGSLLPAYRGMSTFFFWRSQHLSVTLSLEYSGSSLSLYLFTVKNDKASLLSLGADTFATSGCFCPCK